MILAVLASCSSGQNEISGVVLDEKGVPLAGAVVRVKATDKFTSTNNDGKFRLTALRAGESYLLTAWAPGYYIGGGEIEYAPGESNAEFVLTKHTDSDNPYYQWVSAFIQPGVKGSNCEECHSALTPSLSGEGLVVKESLPFDEWMRDAHSQSAVNPRFLTMYTGADVNGNQSPITGYTNNRDYGRVPLRPDLTQPYFGPGYKLDFPETAGNCAACHAPAAAINDPYGVDPTSVTSVGVEGVACDFCHKVWDVRLDSTGLPHPKMPGVLSFEFRRPPEGHQFFAGPFDDIAPGEDTYTPIQRQSQYCAPCHFGVFWNTQIYNSFGEWLQSPYSDLETGKSCQDCHMPTGKTDHFARLSKGGVIRNPQTIFSHLMSGASAPDLLRSSVSMDVSAVQTGDELTVTVTILNDQTGHHVPTDSPLRHLILLVHVEDSNGVTLPQVGGLTVPEYGGIGDPDKGYYAGLPGKIFAKILMELWTEITPTGAYWNPTRTVSDNRLAAFESDTSEYTFAAPADGKASVKVTLLFRRAFRELMDQKGWIMADIIMEEEYLFLNGQ
jgi:hypothetical protein